MQNDNGLALSKMKKSFIDLLVFKIFQWKRPSTLENDIDAFALSKMKTCHHLIGVKIDLVATVRDKVADGS